MKKENKIAIFSRCINSFLTTAIISSVLTGMNAQAGTFPVYIWIRSWTVAFMIVFIVSSFLPNLVLKYVKKWIS